MKKLKMTETMYWDCLEAARSREISLEDYIISTIANWVGVKLEKPETVIDCPSIDSTYPFAYITLDVPSKVISALISDFPGYSFGNAVEYILERQLYNSYPLDSTMLDLIDDLPEDYFD